MSFYAFRFEAKISTLDYGRYNYTVVYLPDELAGQLPLAKFPRLRVEGEIAEYPFNAALIPAQQGRHLIIPPELMKAASLQRDDLVEVRFNIADQDGVAVPEELQVALSENPLAAAVWERMTPGRRRGLAYLVAKPKGEETRAKKAADLVHALEVGGPLPEPPMRKSIRHQ